MQPESFPTGLLLDSYFCAHVTHPGHPECPERIAAIEERLHRGGLAEACLPLHRTPAERGRLLANHSEAYLKRLQTACEGGLPYIDVPDSSICPASFETAVNAAGGVLAAIDAVQSGACKNAFCAVRPPGHHAEHGHSMGFCLLNNVAIGARYLLDHYKLSRVFILDWDVHHGNGTQNSFYDSPSVFFCSLHQHPMTLYPGTGFEKERGSGAGEGYTLNIPMRPGSGDADYKNAFERHVLPALAEFKPEFILVSAGFDAHREDAISSINLDDESYRWMSAAVCDAAASLCTKKIVSMLEGGYALDALGRSASAHVAELISG